MIDLWRRRWSARSRLTRFGFWLAVVPAVLGLAIVGARSVSDHLVPGERTADVAAASMFLGLAVQGAGRVRDRRARRRTQV